MRKQINYTYDDIRKWLEHFRTRADGGESENGVKEKKRQLGFSIWVFVYPCYGAPTYRKNEHGNIHGKQTGIILRGGIAAVGL